MKKSIFLFFATLLCATSAWAYTISSAKIYYDDSNSQWGSDVVVAFDKSNGGAVFAMTKIANTNLYYWTGSWGDGAVDYMRFGKTTKTYDWYGWWNDVKNTWDLSTTDNWSGVSNGWGLDIKNASKLFGANSNSSGADLTKTDLTNYSSLNSTQTIISAYKVQGGNYTETNTPAQISITSYALTANGVATKQNVNLATTVQSGSVSAARTATTTLKIDAVPEKYKFDGWFTGLNDGDRLSEELTYTYYPTEATTIYARFSENVYFLAGTLDGNNNWAADELRMEKDDEGNYSYTFTNPLNAGEYLFKVTDGTWGKEWNWNNVVGQYCELSADDPSSSTSNIKLTLSSPSTFTITFNKTKNQISFDGLTDKYTYFLMGVKGDWTKGIQMVKHPSNANEYMLTCQPIVKETDAIKVVKFECGNPNVYCGTVEDKSVEHAFTNDDNKNIVLNTGVYDFYYKISENKVYIGASSCVVEYTITANSTEGGTVTGARTYDHGANVTLTAKANEGYKFVNWTKAGVEVSTANPYEFTATEDVELVANFAKEEYTRTTTIDSYGTICLPFGSDNYTGAEFYEVAYLVEGIGLWLDQLAAGDQLVAGKPYIFKATATELVVVSNATEVAAPVAGANGLTGTFTEIAANGDLVGNYIIAENKVWVAGKGATLSANRAYIDAAKVPKTAQAQLPGRRRVQMGENAATGVDNITNTDNTTIKVIENGQLIIIRNGEKFNAQGVRL